MRPDLSLAPTGERPRPPRSGELPAAREDLAAMLAHELKTPLAAISMNLDFAVAELPPGTGAELRGALTDCRDANAAAIRIVTDIADAVRLAAGQRKIVARGFDAQSAVAEAVRRLAEEASARGVRIVWLAESTIVYADEDLLTRALERIVERGLRHAQAGGAVDITLRERILAVRVRAAKAHPSRDPAGAMHALGVHFAEVALRAQGGALWLEQDADGALVFSVALPS